MEYEGREGEVSGDGGQGRQKRRRRGPRVIVLPDGEVTYEVSPEIVRRRRRTPQQLARFYEQTNPAFVHARARRIARDRLEMERAREASAAFHGIEHPEYGQWQNPGLTAYNEQLVHDLHQQHWYGEEA